MSAIKTIDSLKDYLYRAMQLEHATIPTYLTALYSIHPQTNSDAVHVIRVVLVEEMLHLTIAANLMNAIGGEVDMTKDGFVPAFPTYLPDGETDFQVSLECLSPSTIQTFLQIERPSLAPDPQSRLLARKADDRATLAACPGDDSMKYYSIGDFYEAIAEGLKYLYAEMGDALFCGDPAKQVGPEYYYSGGGNLQPITDLETALEGIDLIQGQGEGALGEPYDAQGELAHFYRFEQLVQGQYYQPGDEAHQPTGPKCDVDWSAVYPTVTNPSVALFEKHDPEIAAVAQAFNQGYYEFLGLLTEAFGGKPEMLLDAVHGMFRLRSGAMTLIRNPLRGTQAHALSSVFGGGDEPANAGPTFEMAGFTR